MTDASSRSFLKQNCLWITWERQIRNRSMAHLLGVPLKELFTSKTGLVRYIILSKATISHVLTIKPKVLFVQNPSIVLACLALILGKIRSFKVVVDAHNSGIYPLEGRSWLLNKIANNVLKYADIVIVTNNELSKKVVQEGGKPFVMTDPIPHNEYKDISPYKGAKNYLLFICSWSNDEPYERVIDAASLLDSDVDLYITGNFNKKLSQSKRINLPENIKLLGFVSEEDYWAYLMGCSATIDLTTRENCLVCGAYESISAHKPAIVSDTKVNRETFKKGFVYTKDIAQEISNSIDYIILHNKQMNFEIQEEYLAHKTSSKEAKLRLFDQIQRLK